jgi:hypothetical protein
MPAELPIACSLTTTELPARLAEMAALGRDALVEAHRERAHAELRFAASAGVRERVEGIVQGEARCCAFLTMDVRDEPDLVVLDVRAPAEADLILGELVGAFRGESQIGG